MPGSDPRNDDLTVDALLDRFGGAVERVVSELRAAREQAGRMGQEYEALRSAVGGSDGAELSPDVEKRLAVLADENARLRATLEEARARADRIRSRLAVVEDEI